MEDSGRAYALASWARFDGEVTGELLRAVCSAFALVSAADGDVSKSEINRFVGVLRESESSLPPLDITALERVFRELGEAMLTDPTAGKQRAATDRGSRACAPASWNDAAR